MPGGTENESLQGPSVSVLSLQPGISRTQAKSIGDRARHSLLNIRVRPYRNLQYKLYIICPVSNVLQVI